MIRPLLEVALNNSTYTEIDLPAGFVEKTVILQADSAIDVYLSDTSAGTNKFTLKSGASLAVSVTPAAQEGKYKLCFAKSASATPNLQLLLVD